ncbi:AaceriAGR327Cp [[Ashbya] aceris (nom. inval.)]|nr:AaceriAGR327Cp [[Ashbya] aceris (nom. inval.)]
MKYIALLLIMLSCCIAADTISDIAFSGLNIEAVAGSQRYPHQGWAAKFDYHIKDASKIKTSDYFIVTMPSVYKIKFDNKQNQFNVGLDGKDIFKCYALQQAAYIHEDTVLKCEALGDMSGYKKIDGTISLTLVFSDGGSIFAHEYKNAARFHVGFNELSFNGELKGNFEAASVPHTDGFYYSGKTSTYNSLELYYLGFNCPTGYVLGANHRIEYDKSHPIDCSKLQVFKSKKFNDWLLPLDYGTLEEPIECSGDMVKISHGPLEPGYRVWANVLQALDAETVTISNTIHFDYTCTDTNAGTTYTTTTQHTPVVVITEGMFTGTASEPPVAPHTIVTKTICTQCSTSKTSSPSSSHKPSYVTLTKTECTVCSGETPTVSSRVQTSKSSNIATKQTGSYPSYASGMSSSTRSTVKSASTISNTQTSMTAFSSSTKSSTKTTYGTAVTKPFSPAVSPSSELGSMKTSSTSNAQPSSPSGLASSDYSSMKTSISSAARPSSIACPSSSSQSDNKSTSATAVTNTSVPVTSTGGSEPPTYAISNTQPHPTLTTQRISTIDPRSTNTQSLSTHSPSTVTVLTTSCDGGCSSQPSTSARFISASENGTISTKNSSSATVKTMDSGTNSFSLTVPPFSISSNQVTSMQTSVVTSSVLRNSTLTRTVQSCNPDCSPVSSTPTSMSSQEFVSASSTIPSTLPTTPAESLVPSQPSGISHALPSISSCTSAKIISSPTASSAIRYPEEAGFSTSSATPIPSTSISQDISPSLESREGSCGSTTTFTTPHEQHTGDGPTTSESASSAAIASLPKPTQQPQSSVDRSSSAQPDTSSITPQGSTNIVPCPLGSSSQSSIPNISSQATEYMATTPGPRTIAPKHSSGLSSAHSPTSQGTVVFSSLRATEVPGGLSTPNASTSMDWLSPSTSIKATASISIFRGEAAGEQFGSLSKLVLLVVPYLLL